MKYKISIIIPIYNVAPYIEKCLDSVVNQTMTEGIECILVDDCGTDNSIEIADHYIKDYDGDIMFSIVHRKSNGGLSAARNTGICNATGEYLYFLDSDDEITSNCMELMYGLIKKYGSIDLVQGSFYETEKELKSISRYDFPEFSRDRKQIKSFLLKYEGDIVGAQSRLIRREFLYKYNLMFKEGIIHEDNYWTFFLAKHVKTMAFCPKPTYYHRFNPNSITNARNIDKEYKAYHTIITDFSSSIDSFLPGRQKELILNNLLTALNICKDKSMTKNLINPFLSTNTFLEKFLLMLYINTRKKLNATKILHLLIRLYKISD